MVFAFVQTEGISAIQVLIPTIANDKIQFSFSLSRIGVLRNYGPNSNKPLRSFCLIPTTFILLESDIVDLDKNETKF